VDITTAYGSKVAASYGATSYPYTVITDASCRKVVFRGSGQFTPARWRKTLETYRGSTSHWPAVEKVESVDVESSADESVADVPRAKLFAHADLATAQATARRRKRPLLVFVTMRGCHYCERMKAETFADAELTEQITAEFETVVVQQENESTWVQQQSVTMFPTTLIFSPAGKRLGRFDGFVATGKLRQRLRSLALGRLTAR
jgi:thioredoxin-related protein